RSLPRRRGEGEGAVRRRRPTPSRRRGRMRSLRGHASPPRQHRRARRQGPGPIEPGADRQELSAPSSNTCRLLPRDHAAPESTLALAKAASLGRERVRPLAWCSRPRSSAALLEGALMDLAIRALVLYAFVFILTRVVGRRELSSLQPFDLILLIVLGDSIQQGLTQDDYSITGALIVVGTIAVLQVATSYVSFRVPLLRPVLDGQPIVVVEDGKPIQKNLHRERISVEELTEEMR